MNLYEKIQDAMTTDEEDIDEKAVDIEIQYNKSTDDEKKAIDRVFVNLTGYSLFTLITGEKDSGYNPFS